jgi:hypothetical protein
MQTNVKCFLVIALTAVVMTLTSCAGAGFIWTNDGNANNDFPIITQGDNLVSYKDSILANAERFAVTIASNAVSEIDPAHMTQVDIENISARAYSFIKLQVIFADTAGNIIMTDEAGIYGYLGSGEVVAKYHKNFDRRIAQAYVVDYIDNIDLDGGSIGI